MMKTIKLFFLCFLLLTSTAFAAPVPKFSINLHPVRLSELARLVYSDLLKKNYVLDGAFLADGFVVSINWQDLPLSKIDKMTRDLIQSKGYVITEFSNVLFIKPIHKIDDELLIYPVRFRSAKYLTDMISRLTGDSQAGSRGLPPPSTGTPAIPDGGAVASLAQVFDHSALDQIIYTCSASECKRIKNLLIQLDTSEPNVILHAFVYEVTLILGQASALDIVASLLDTGTALSLTGTVVPSASTLQFKTAGFNALISKLDNDSRFNSVSRPTLRVKTGITAKFNVGSQVPILGNATLDKNGNPVQSIDYKQSGTIFTVTPDIRGNVIDLEIHQELSSFVLTTTGVNNSPTLIQRTANSTLSLHENEIVAFAGLEEDTDNATSRKLFGFIPISTTKSKNTTEILLFIYAEKIQP